MARPSHVPKFGNWDANNNVAYTVVFDKARVSKSSKPINPNDPQENPSAFSLRPDDPLETQRNRSNVRPPPPAAWERRPDATPPRPPVPERQPDRGAALPKFGDWNENDPSSGEGYTMIFSKAKDERKSGGPVHIPPPRNEPSATTPTHDAYRQRSEAQHSKTKKPSLWSCCGL